MENPKLFISYSWSSPEHESWVLQLATELVESGVDVILDKWHLKEGHDANQFMEQMVGDPEIKKVILICDKVYAQKADKRKGGTGTEAQIISSEIYKKQHQEKFVAVIKEKDENNNAYLPIYYKSRIYIDLAEPENHSKNFEQLLRWIYDKPLHKKPVLGKKPAFIEDSTSLTLPTSVMYRRVVDALKNQKDYSEGTLSDYFSIFTDNFEKLRIKKENGEYDEKVIESIEAFLPFRDELIEIFLLISKYRDNDETRIILHRFLENLIPFLSRPEHIKNYSEWDFDNYKFIIHEIFLYLIGILIKYEKFDSAAYLMRNQYFVVDNPEYGREQMIPFRVFRKHMKTLVHRNKRLNLNRLSLRADLLSKRCTNSQFPFRYLMQADFVLFIRDHLENSEHVFHWWPETLLYVNHIASAFEVFARSQSLEYFNKSKRLFDIQAKEDLNTIIEAFEDEQKNLIPSWQFESFSPRHLLGFDKLATQL